MPKTICAPDSLSLKPGSGATEGVLDHGVLRRLGYVTWAELMGYKDIRQRAFPVSRWDSPLHGWQARRPNMYFPFSVNRLCTTLGPAGVYINLRV